MSKELAESKKVADHFGVVASQFIGQKVAVLCARYQYRGKLSSVGTDVLVLANATSVESSGPSSGEAPVAEDPIQGSVIIPFGAVELFYQPHWSQAPLPDEKGFRARSG